MVHHPQDRTGRKGGLNTAETKTIAALATPPGRGGVAIVRISGPGALEIGEAIAGPLPPPRQARHRRFVGAAGEVIDDGLLLVFPAPASFTGEDVVEFQGHGGPVVVDRLLSRILGLGARAARPGEFSERAFLNGRIDLVQAEAIADLIDSASVAASRAARRSLDGEFSRRIEAIRARLVSLRVEVEAGLDFADEPLDLIDEPACRTRLAELDRELAALDQEARRGSRLREGMKIVIAGPPNAGKSSLLNRLARHERAIVSPIPGTTRDVLREEIVIDGLPVQILDTAGLRDGADPVERLGIERAHGEIDTADCILHVTDGSDSDPAPMARITVDPTRLVHIVNKIDLLGRSPGIETAPTGQVTIHLSARSGDGVELLTEHLKARAGHQSSDAGLFMARRRHLEALGRTREAVTRALGRRPNDESELIAEDLRLAQQALGEITGEFTSDDLLGEIFSSFCIGK